MILYRIADKIIFNILKKINVGYLEITSTTGELLRFGNYNEKLKAEGKTPAVGERVLMGITKASLQTESIISPGR